MNNASNPPAERRVAIRDTHAWIIQTRASFAASLALVGAWMIWGSGSGQDKGLLFFALSFCLFASVALSKTLRDNRDSPRDSSGWLGSVWAAFGLSLGGAAWSVANLSAGTWEKGFLAAAALLLLQSAFSVAKQVRDEQEADWVDSEGK